MKEYIPQPWLTEPKARADRFLQGTTTRLIATSYMYSETLKWYWLYWKISTKRVLLSFRLNPQALLELQRRTKTVACEPPVGDETGKP